MKIPDVSVVDVSVEEEKEILTSPLVNERQPQERILSEEFDDEEENEEKNEKVDVEETEEEKEAYIVSEKENDEVRV